MGFFGTYVYDGSDWYEVDPDKVPAGRLSPPSLWVQIHDSDFAVLVYAPYEPGTGIAFLGDTPRTYFEDPIASIPTDVATEATGLAAWVATVLGNVGPQPDQIQGWLAQDDMDDESADTGIDDDAGYVENKVSKFLMFLGLPVPAGLPH
ncbi:MAG: hypothetical protein JWP74_3489 [Marmoricola sp.]|nr:hypothetical protein [Marmoricola sp.]